MEDLRAFVGHSFSDHDKALGASFLAYFGSLSKLYPTFSWDHAEEAEPLPLSTKVLNKITDKNVFIGICTKTSEQSPIQQFGLRYLERMCSSRPLTM